MKRSWNGYVWAGLLVTVVALVSYIPLFARFPSTRDFPWANLLLFALALVLLAVGTKRAFSRPERYRGKIAGPLFSFIAVASLALFVWSTFVFARRLPSPATALEVGRRAPDLTLDDIHGQPVSLSQMLKTHRAALLVFYRGYW
jgi:ABC-type transport system involved in cytochrome c biogenesis permease subunit